MPSHLSAAEQKQVQTVIDRARGDRTVPHSAQESIPFQRMFPDGICRVTDNYYTKTIQFQDINYQLAQQEDQTAIFEEWCSFLNFFDSSIRFELSFMNMYFDAKEFGKRLHDVRTSRGITQEELAVRLGLASKQHVSRMENGERSCSIDLLIELSCILHVSTDYLLMGSEPSKEEVKNDLLSIISELSTIAKKI